MPIHATRGKVLLTVAAAFALVLATGSASAAHTGSVVTGYTVNVRSGPGTQYPVVTTLPAETWLAIGCTVRGQWVTGPYGATDVWDYVHYEGYVSDAYVYTGQAEPVGPDCGSATLHWDQSYRVLGVEQPGTRALYNELKADPRWNVRGGDRHFGGIYSGRVGQHGEGRALDFWMDADNPAELEVGWALAEYLRANAAAYGVQTIIWNDKVWLSFQPGAGWQEYDEESNCGTGKTCKHNDHVHISQNWAGALLQTSHWA